MDADVVVVGAGPAGAALACQLAPLGWRVVLIDAEPEPTLSVGETLPGRSLELLARLGLREDFESAGHAQAYARRSVWGGPDALEESSIVDPYGPGWHLDRAAFDRWLVERAVRSGAQLLRPARVRSAVRKRATWKLVYRTGKNDIDLHARFVVDATGFSASLSRRLGAVRRCVQRMAGVARWFSDAESDTATLIEATESGWWYSAPLPKHRLVAVWMTDAGSATVRAYRSDDVWRHCLEQAPLTAGRLLKARPLDARVVRVTGHALTDFDSGIGYMPVGDAAVTLDPISGQGLSLALRSALEAASTLLRAADGDAHSVGDYRSAMALTFECHLALRRATYRVEQRFAHAPFWRKAHHEFALGTGRVD